MKARVHESREDYLEAVLVMTNEKGYCRSVDIATDLHITKPSVSVGVSKLVAEGLLTMDDEKFLHLTDEGRKIAEDIYERHCWFRKALLAVGVEPEEAETEACALEHDISRDTFEKIRNSHAKVIQKAGTAAGGPAEANA